MFGRKEKEKHFDWSTLKLAKEKGEKPDEIELAAAAITAAQSQLELAKLSQPGGHMFDDDTLTDQPERVLAVEVLDVSETAGKSEASLLYREVNAQ